MTTGQSGGTGHGGGKWVFAALGAIADAAAVVGLVNQGAGPVLITAVFALGLAGVAALFAPQRPLKIAGAAAMIVALLSAVGLLSSGIKYADGLTPSSSSPATNVVPSDRVVPPGSEADSTSVTMPAATTRTTSTRATPPAAAATNGPPQSVEGWYNLTAYEAVAFGNGHYSVPSINIGIGKDPFFNSIRGSYSSSTAQPNNYRTWLTGGKCNRLSVWVGKDAASSQTAGVGQFLIKAENVEVTSRQATINDAPQHIDIDISNVIRLTLLDIRGGRDADNAWGTPRVYCTAPPGKAH